MSYLGQQLGQGQAERFVYTATGGETSVTNDDAGRAIAYTVGQVDVYLNGAKLINGSDFTATTGTSITGLAALTASDVVEVFALSIFQASDTVSASTGGTFNGNVTVDANLSVTGTTTITTADINGGTIDGTTIGGTTPAAGSFTTLTASGDVNFDSGTLFVDESTNRVGVGTTSPARELHISGANPTARIENTGSALYAILSLVDDTGEQAYVWKNGSAQSLYGGARSLQLWNVSNAAITFGTNDTERMRIDSSGRVGIGTSTPLEFNTSGSASARLLTVYNSGTSSGTRGEIQIGNAATTSGQFVGGVNFGSGASTTTANVISAIYGITNGDNTTLGSGDLAFYTAASGSNTERMRIDSTGNVGIGTSPSFDFHAFRSGPLNSVFESDTGNSNLRITSGDGDIAQIFFGDQTNDTISQIKHDNSDNSLAFFTAGSNERMRIASGGNVGVGLSSNISAKLDINNAHSTSGLAGVVANPQLAITNSQNWGYPVGMLFRTPLASSGAPVSNNAAIWSQWSSNTNAYLGFATTGSGTLSEAMRIDSSGNLLVGQTSTTVNTNGAVIGAAGSLSKFSRNGGSTSATLVVNKQTNDGVIVAFQKDGTTVGSIGVANGDNLYIAADDTTDVGLKFDGDANAIYGCDASGGIRDAAITLGDPAVRFKDLYLSGGVYLGGTGAANKLDDYEEGTYVATLTPQSSGTITLGPSFDTLQYTKVGNLVNVSGRLRVSSVSSPAGSWVVLSLPFTSAGLGEDAGRVFGVVSVANGSVNIQDYGIHPTIDGNSYVQIGITNSTGFTVDAAPTFSGDENVAVNITYRTT